MKYRFDVNLITFFYLISYFLGSYNLYLFFQNSFDKGFFVLLFNFVLCLIGGLFFKEKLKETIFNRFFCNIVLLYSFGFTIFFYGILKFSYNLLLFILLSLFLLGLFLNVTRNWFYNLNNNLGWPILFNGLFFPLFYFFLKTYIGEMIFILGLYLVVFILSITNLRFFKEKELKNDLEDGDEIKNKSEDKSEKIQGENIDKKVDNNVNKNQNFNENENSDKNDKNNINNFDDYEDEEVYI